MVLKNWLKTIKDVNLRPTEFFQGIDGEGFEKPVKFAALTGTVYGVILSSLILVSTVFSQETFLSGLVGALVLLVAMPVGIIISTFFGSALVHLAVYLFGKRGFDKTYNAVTYPRVAVSIWGWIPVLNLVAAFYSIYMQARGLEELHEMDFGKALISAGWPLILGVIAFTLVLVAALVGSFVVPVESINSTA
jgi:hypothetical protein